MLYIDDIGNNTIRFSDTLGGGGYDKYLPNNMVARGDEINRVWVLNSDSGLNELNSYDPANITINGVVYVYAANFVPAFNAMMAEEAALTTTTTTGVTTTTTTA